jgi:RHS repeat-associated protein
MASSVQQGTVTDAFTYDADHNRASQAQTSNGSPVNTVYYFFDPITGLEADYTTAPNGSTLNWTDYVKIGGQLVMIHTMTPSNTNGVNNYVVTDHLGSVAVVTNYEGCSWGTTGTPSSCIVERDSYDAWGQRRNPNGSDAQPGRFTNSSVTSKAYTGQEQLQGVGLLNYNARMYDPLVGKFLSADPDVELGNLQAMNPYTYAMNNPLSNTDPTGMKCHGWFSCTFGAAAPIVDVIVVAIAAAACGPGAPVCAGVAAGLAQTGVGLANGENLGLSLEQGAITGVTVARQSG